MRHAGVRLCQHAQLLVVEVDAVSEPDVAARPAEALHVLERADALACEHEVFLVLRLAQVGVQAHAVLSREHGALAQKVGRHGERRARGERNAVHRAERLVVVFLDDTGGIGHDLVDRLHDAVGRQAAVLDREVHTAARGVHARADLVRRGKLRANEVARARREDIVMVEAGRAAVLHQLAKARERREADDVLVEVFPDLIERFEPVEELHVLYFRQVAGKDLIEMMVRVDKAGVAEHVARVNHLFRLLRQIFTDRADESILSIQIDVFINRVRVITRHQRTNVLNEQSRHSNTS